MRKLRKSDGSRLIAFAGSAKFKRGAVNTAILVVLSVILAVVVRFATLSDDNVADAVLRGEPFLQIVVLSLIIGVIMSTLIAYTYYVKRDADRSVTAKLVPVLAVAVFITFILALVFGVTLTALFALGGLFPKALKPALGAVMLGLLLAGVAYAFIFVGNYGVIMANSIGIIENSYCGNDDVWAFPAVAIRRTKIPKGTRLCQFQLVKQAEPIEFEEVDDLGNPNRGGIGSTGDN